MKVVWHFGHWQLEYLSTKMASINTVERGANGMPAYQLPNKSFHASKTIVGMQSQPNLREKLKDLFLLSTWIVRFPFP